jgi:hypothetical protein
MARRVMLKSFSVSYKLFSLVETISFGSMAFGVEPSAPVSLSKIFETTGYGYTLQVTSPTGAAFVHDGKMYVQEGVEYTFKLTVTEEDKWYIGIQPTQDDGITLDYDKRNGSQDGAGPNSTYIDITKTFTKAGTHVIAKAFYFQGESFSRLSMTTVDIEVHIIKVEITKVPPAYYADSEAWVPFRFKIEGCSGPVTITSGMVDIYLGGVFQNSFDFTSYPFKPSNGTASEYLAVIDQSKFDTISRSSQVKNNLSLRLRDICVQVPGLPSVSCDSGFSAAMDFADKTVEVVEIGHNDSFPFNKKDTRQDKLDQVSYDSYVHVAGDGWLPPVWLPLPKEISEGEARNRGFDSCYTGPSAVGPNFLEQWSHLLSYKAVLGGPYGNTVDANSLDRQYGVYWVVYFNQVKARDPVNPFGVDVVGTVESHSGQFSLFAGATGRATLESSESKIITEGFGWVPAIAKVAALYPPFRTVMTAKATISAFLQQTASTVDATQRHPERAEVMVMRAYGNEKNSVVFKSVPGLCRTELGGTSKHTLDLISETGSLVVGNRYRFLLSLSTSVRAKSEWWSKTEVNSKIRIDVPDKKFRAQWDKPAPGNTSFSKIMCDF